MEAMPVVSFRISEEDKAALEAQGVNPGLRARELLLEELERRRFEEAQRFLDEVSRPPSQDIVEMIREMREERP